MTPIRRRYDTDLSEAEWALLLPLLPPEQPGGRHRENDLRCPFWKAACDE